MYTSLGVAVILVALLGVMIYYARVLLPLISPALQVLVILLVTIIALYAVGVLLGFVGIHVPVPWVSMTAGRDPAEGRSPPRQSRADKRDRDGEPMTRKNARIASRGRME
jgi:hypothetical protein